MNITFKNSIFSVVDDFLDQDDFNKLCNYVKDIEYKYYEFAEQTISVSTLIVSSISSKTNHTPFPSNTPFDAVINKVSDNLDHIITTGFQYKYFFARAMVITAGTHLGWHKDPEKHGYAFYCHDQWQQEWGGELMMNTGEEHIGQYIYPSPNRFVTWKNNIFHSVNRVEISAKKNSRIGIVGAFEID